MLCCIADHQTSVVTTDRLKNSQIDRLGHLYGREIIWTRCHTSLSVTHSPLSAGGPSPSQGAACYAHNTSTACLPSMRACVAPQLPDLWRALRHKSDAPFTRRHSCLFMQPPSAWPRCPAGCWEAPPHIAPAPWSSWHGPAGNAGQTPVGFIAALGYMCRRTITHISLVQPAAMAADSKRAVQPHQQTHQQTQRRTCE